MSNYEFWDELGKIFNAVVAYQEKTIEFNKRFINPWIRLGNVFDKQDRNEEAICAYHQAIEIDPNNGQNWYEVGNIHFRMEKYDEAAEAYNHAIELDPGSGSPYSNLALTLVTQGKYVEALPLYRKAIELLEDNKDKAVAWNRLGNLYRKLNEYELAVEAFHKADELDQDNAGFRDNLDEVPDGPTLVEATGDGEGQAIPVAPSLSELIPLDSQTEAVATAVSEDTANGIEASMDIPTQPTLAIAEKIETTDEPTAGSQVEVEAPVSDDQFADAKMQEVQIPVDTAAKSSDLPVENEQPVLENAAETINEPIAEVAAVANETETANVESEVDDQTLPVAVTAAEGDQPDKGDETITIVVQNTVETITETVTVTNTATETSDAALTVATTEEVIPATDVKVEEIVVENPEGVDNLQASKSETVVLIESPVEIASPTEASMEAATEVVNGTEENNTESVDPVLTKADVVENVTVEVTVVDEASVSSETTEVPAVAQTAYEEYLKDSNDPIHIYQSDASDKAAEVENTQTAQEPVAKINTNGELQIEMDTKNAHVWNELGNVYFNTGAFDDAVIAYSKAIELDRWFAWPYSNLALTYVQKGRFVEAILLYQRSIELFTSDKDKAISWNRLGNVYRRINDYDNAIASYQRADELDPDNTTLSLQSRFSLLGSYVMEQKPTYVS